MGASELALVISGGGARAAYQVGFLRRLARELPELQLDILTGVSAGAINAAYMAAAPYDFESKTRYLCELWQDIETQDVFKTGWDSLGKQIAGWLTQLGSGGAPAGQRTRGLVDTRPLKKFLKSHLRCGDGPIPGISENLASGRLKALAVTSSSYATGRSVTWVQGRDIQTWERPNRTSVKAEIGIEHVMASAALPLFFPAVKIGGQWYGDGGLRMSAPLAPAVHLGADKILAISTRYIRTPEEAEEPASAGYPPPAQVIGVLMNAIFLDLFDHDAAVLERTNHLLEQLPAQHHGQLRRVELMLVRPSTNLGKLANEFEPWLPTAFRFLTRGLGTKEVRSNDALSMVMFQPDYIARLIEIGEADADARLPELKEFLT